MSIESDAEIQTRNTSLISDKLSALANYVALTAATVGVAVTATTLFQSTSSNKAQAVDPVAGAAYQQARALRLEVNSVKQRQDAIEKGLQQDPNDPALRSLSSRLTVIENRQKDIERIILADPAKSIELPLIRKDIESDRASNAQSFFSIRESVNQIYDLTNLIKT